MRRLVQPAVARRVERRVRPHIRLLEEVLLPGDLKGDLPILLNSVLEVASELDLRFRRGDHRGTFGVVLKGTCLPGEAKVY